MVTAKCGVVSITTTGRHNVAMAGVPTCDAPSIKRVIFTRVLGVARQMRRCTSRIHRKH